MITPTISLLELITGLLLLSAIGLKSRALWLQVGDNGRLHQQKDFIHNGPRHRQVKINIRNSSFNLLSMVMFLLAVGVLMTQPPAYGSAYSAGAVLVILSILTTITGMSIDTILYLYNRERILYDLENPRHPTPSFNRGKVVVEDHEGVLMVPVDVERKL
jgi:hypothetical protein